MLLLVVGLAITGHAILTPRLMAILMITGDFLAMSATTDNVHPSRRPNAWHVDSVTLLGVTLALCNVMFCTAVVAVGYFRLSLARAELRTLAAVRLVFVGQATFYVVRDRRRLWNSWPSGWIVVSSAADVLIITVLATQGILMAAVPAWLVGIVLGASVVLTVVLDAVKAAMSRSLQMQ